jgi:hypothetical protein
MSMAVWLRFLEGYSLQWNWSGVSVDQPAIKLKDCECPSPMESSRQPNSSSSRLRPIARNLEVNLHHFKS